jgi:hypothetical protein
MDWESIYKTDPLAAMGYADSLEEDGRIDESNRIRFCTSLALQLFDWKDEFTKYCVGWQSMEKQATIHGIPVNVLMKKNPFISNERFNHRTMVQITINSHLTGMIADTKRFSHVNAAQFAINCHSSKRPVYIHFWCREKARYKKMFQIAENFRDFIYNLELISIGKMDDEQKSNSPIVIRSKI